MSWSNPLHLSPVSFPRATFSFFLPTLPLPPHYPPSPGAAATEVRCFLIRFAVHQPALIHNAAGQVAGANAVMPCSWCRLEGWGGSGITDWWTRGACLVSNLSDIDLGGICACVRAQTNAHLMLRLRFAGARKQARFIGVSGVSVGVRVVLCVLCRETLRPLWTGYRTSPPAVEGEEGAPGECRAAGGSAAQVIPDAGPHQDSGVFPAVRYVLQRGARVRWSITS